MTSPHRQLATKTRECEEARKALQRQTDASALVAEKDGIITQVMAEGQALSKKVGDLEAAQKKLRASLKDALSEREKLTAKLAAEEARAAQAEATSAEAVRKALVEVTDTKQFYAAEMQRMQGAAADADARAGLERRLRDAHEKEARLEDKVAGLTAQLSRAVEEASRREDGLRAEISTAHARCNEAEARHEELAARMPEATRPLLRQVEALQRAAAEQAGVWAATEAALCGRADAADAAASKAATAAASAREALQVAQARAAAATEAEAAATSVLAACRQECGQLRVALETARGEAAAAASEAATVASQAAAARTIAVSTETALRGQLADWRARAEALEASSQLQAKQADARVGELTQQVAELQQQVDELTARAAAFSHAVVPTSAPTHTRQSARLVPGLAGHEEALVERRLASLEAAKQRLSDELVAMTSRATAAEAAAAEAGQLRQRLGACVTLLGERDEHVEELTVDIVELRKLAQRQAEALATNAERDRAARRSVLDGGHAAAAAPSS
jgi:chromosome segregation ATPase